MRIYFIGQKGIPAKSGGVEAHVQELAVNLAAAGHEVFVYTRPSYTDAKLVNYKGVNLISLPSIATKHLDAISHTFMACLDVSKRKADIIHFHSIGPSSLLWLVKLLKPGVPVISTFHTRCYTHKKWGIFARICLRLGEMSACFFADKTITVSRSLTLYAKNAYGRLTEYIPNGVSSPKKLKVKEIKKWGLEKDSYILTVSRLIRHKGLHHLIKAYKNLKTDKKLVIVGEGMFTDKYVKELKVLAGNNKNIVFTGSQSGDTLTELFSNAYLFVQPSESEGLSIALLEAMSFERGVLVSDIPENKEAIGDFGFTFKNKNVADLKNKLKYLLKNKALISRMGKLGRKRVEEFYDWDDIAKNIVRVYKKAINEKRAHKINFGELKLAKKIISLIF